MKMICSQCQEKNTEGSQFCSQCGAKLVSEMDATVSFAGPIEVSEEAQIDFEKLDSEGPLLVVVKGIGVGQTFEFAGQDVVIGRDPENDIFLDDITVSRKHAMISRRQGKETLEDTGSLNGTYLNNERVDRAYLRNRDEIQIGKFKMVFLDKPEENHGA